MTRILCIETSAEVCSVALAQDGEVIDLTEDVEGRAHSKLLTVFIEEILKRNKMSVTELDAVSVSKGPGSYTGLRIGVSVAKGLCYGTSLPLIAVPTLEALTYGYLEEVGQPGENAILVPLMDARRMEVYYAFYTPEIKVLQDSIPLIIDKNSFRDELLNSELHFFGDGAGKCQSIIQHQNAIFNLEINYSAKNLSKPSFERYNRKEFADLAYFEPSYLKPFVAIKAKNKVLK